jgi:FtsZ-binding cell division protein ZapB
MNDLHKVPIEALYKDAKKQIRLATVQILDLKELNSTLAKENRELRGKLNKLIQANDDIKKDIKKSEIYESQKATIQKLQKTVRNLRETNSNLVYENTQLRINNNQKLKDHE